MNRDTVYEPNELSKEDRTAKIFSIRVWVLNC
jgi:hypothetical protein